MSGSSFDNRLLAALPQEVYGRLCSALDPVAFALGDVVYDTGARLAHIYFPTTCVVSLIYTMEDGATAEMGLVGNEGAVGIALFMGGEQELHCRSWPRSTGGRQFSRRRPCWRCSGLTSGWCRPSPAAARRVCSCISSRFSRNDPTDATSSCRFKT